MAVAASPEQRVLRHFHLGDPDECWVWKGCLTLGYGDFWVWDGPKRRKHVFAHTITFQILHGPIPEGMEVDHICHNRACVNPHHMRLATKSQNAANAVRRSDNTSGYKGVSFDSATGRWRASIQVQKKPVRLGRFKTPEAAHRAYCDAAKKFFGEYANFGETA